MEIDMDWDHHSGPSYFIGIGAGMKLGFLLQVETSAKVGVRLPK